MNLKIAKIILTVLVGYAVFTVAGMLPSSRVALQAGFVPLLIAGIGVIVGVRANMRTLFTMSGPVLAFVGAYNARANWPGLDALMEIPLDVAIASIIPSELSFAFFVTGVVVIGMAISDLIDHCFGVKLIDDRPA
jgi:uncharacterized protein YaaW (UPF0174 family)